MKQSLWNYPDNEDNWHVCGKNAGPSERKKEKEKKRKKIK